MKKILHISISILFVAWFIACNSGMASDDASIPKDQASIEKGGILFNQYCSGCHNFRQDGIGPQLSGITTSVSAEWLSGFIKDPQQLINGGDERAKTLYATYKVAMPSFAGLQEKALQQIIAF